MSDISVMLKRRLFGDPFAALRHEAESVDLRAWLDDEREYDLSDGADPETNVSDAATGPARPAGRVLVAGERLVLGPSF